MRDKIISAIFMLLGFLGLFEQLHKYYYDNLELSIHQFFVTSLCTVFVFRPSILLDVFKNLVSRLKK